MSDELLDTLKLAVASVFLSAVLAFGVGIVYLGNNFWRGLEDQLYQAAASTETVDMYYLCNFEKPVPVAACWKVINQIDPGGEFGLSTLSGFKVQTLEKPYGTNLVVTTDRKKLNRLLTYHCYCSYDEDARTVVITISDGTQAELLPKVV